MIDAADSTARTTKDPALQLGAIGEIDRGFPAPAPQAIGRRVVRGAVSVLADVQEIGDRRVFLSTVAPSRRDWRFAGAIALLALLAFSAGAPFSQVQVGGVPGFGAAYEFAPLLT